MQRILKRKTEGSETDDDLSVDSSEMKNGFMDNIYWKPTIIDDIDLGELEKDLNHDISEKDGKHHIVISSKSKEKYEFEDKDMQEFQSNELFGQNIDETTKYYDNVFWSPQYDNDLDVLDL